MQNSHNPASIGLKNETAIQGEANERARKRAAAQRRISAAVKPTLERLELRQLLSVSAGNLDTTFNTTGKVVAGSNQLGAAMAVEPAGTPAAGDVIIGVAANSQFILDSYSSSGSFISTVNLPIGAATDANITAITLDSSGNIIAAGTAADTGTGNDFAVARFTINAAGTLAVDNTFGTGGYTATDLGGQESATSVALQSNGPSYNILVAGDRTAAGNTRDAIVRYTAAGVKDATFGTAGAVTITTGAGDVANAVVVNSSGITLAGASGQHSELVTMSASGATVVRHSITLATVGGDSDSISAATLTASGEYLVAGEADGNMVVAEVNSGATALDGSFGTSGRTESTFGGAGSGGNSIAVQNNGKLVVGGFVGDNTPNGNEFFGLARYNADGSPDNYFGSAGVSNTVSTDFTGNDTGTSVASSVAVEPDGKIVAAGATGPGLTPSEIAIARYVANNAPTGAANANLDTIDEHQINNPGNTVASLLTRLGASDVDNDTLGIAVIGADNTNGTWQYSTNGGASFTALPAVSTSSAFLLAQTTGAANNVVRFVPTGNFTGNATLTLRVWDETQGTSGTSYTTATSDAGNLNTFASNSSTATINVSGLITPVYVNSAWAGSGQDTPVVDSLGQTHMFGIDAFATIADGLNFVAVNGTVYVDGAAPEATPSMADPALSPYVETDSITQTVTLTGYGEATPVVTAPSTASHSAVISVAAANVTVEGLDVVVNQSNASAGIVAVSGLTGGNIFNGLAILNNTITPTGSEAFGTGFATPFDGSHPYTEGIAVLANGGGTSPTVTIQGNTILPGTGGPTSSLQRGIWLNEVQGSVGGSTAVEGNTVTAYVQDALVAFSRGATLIQNNAFDGVGVTITEPNASAPTTISNNTFNSALGGVDDASLLIKHNYNATSPVTISGNIFTVSNASIGVLSGASIGVSVSGNTFTPAAGAVSTVDVAVDTMIPSGSQPAASTLFPNSIGITGNHFNAGSGAATAIQISNHDAGAITPDFGTITIGGTGAAANTFDKNLAEFIVEAPPTSSVSFSGDNYSGSQVHAGNVPVNIDASGNIFGVSSGDTLAHSNFGLADYYEVEDKITDGIDYSGAGLVRIEAGNVFVTPNSYLAPATTDEGAVQRAVNLGSSGDIINLEAGTYVENTNYVDSGAGVVGELYINKPLTLVGPLTNFNGKTDAVPSTASQAIIEPGTSDPNPFDSSAVVVVYVGSSNVTIQGVTIDGRNESNSFSHYSDPGTNGYNNVTPHHTGYVTVDGTGSANAVDASEGIASYVDVGDINISNDIIEKTGYDGVDFENSSNFSGAATTGNVISENLIAHLSDAYGFGVGVIIYNNFYASISNNQITDALVGVQTGNFSQANPGAPSSAGITSNDITTGGPGIFFNLMYASTSNISVSGNVITASNDPAGEPWAGVLLTSIQDSVNVAFTNNTIDGTLASDTSGQSSGYEVWNTPTTGSVLISGGSVTGVDYGVWLNTYEGYASNADTTQATISGVGISANKIGVYVEDSPQNTNHVAVSATIEGNTSITTGAGGTGILVSGPTATANINGNLGSIDGNIIGINVSGGTASITGNHIYNNATGILITSGGTATVTGNNFNGSSVNLTDLLIDPSAAANPIIGGTLTGNNFAGSSFFIKVGTTQNLDATGATFNGLSSSASTLAQNYSYEDEIVDYLDNPNLGYVKLDPTNVYVADSSETATAGAIQRGINVASSPGTVNVEAGPGSFTYSGGIIINKNGLTLAGTGLPTVGGADFGAQGYGGALEVAANTVTVTGFNLAGDGTAATENQYGVLLLHATSNSTISNNTIGGFANSVLTEDDGIATDGQTGTLIQHNTFNATAGDNFAVQLIGTGGSNQVVNDGNIFNAGESGVLIQNVSGDTVADNSFNTADNAVIVVDADTVHILANNIQNTTGTTIGLDGGATNVVVSQNTIDGSALVAIRVANLFSGTNASNGSISINQNFLDNDTKGVWVMASTGDDGFGDPLNGAALTGNSAITINSNHIAGNATAGVENDSSFTVNADENWWGSATGPTITSNPGGTGDKITGTNAVGVSYAPWLTDGTDQQPATPGFQPNASSGAVSISGSNNGTEGATYTLMLSPSSDTTGWTINWGDGNTVFYAGTPTSEAHTFAEEGHYTISASANTSGGVVNSNNTVSVAVADAALTAGALTPPAATEGAAFTDATVFHFTDAAGASADITDYTAVIQLGDTHSVTLTSTPSANGQIVANAGGYDVQLSYTYAEELSGATFQVTVTDLGGAAPISASTTNFSVADAALTAGAGALTAPTPVEGQPLTNVQLFHFTDANPNALPSDFTATITWGDGTTSVVTSTQSAGGKIVANINGGFDVLGSHTYAEEATGLPFNVSVVDHPVNYSNGFEPGDPGTRDFYDSTTGDQGVGISIVPSGGGQLGLTAPSGGNYAEITNTDDTYQAGYGESVSTDYGAGAADSSTGLTINGPFYESTAYYINTSWAKASANNNFEGFWIDTTPSTDPNFADETNFRIIDTGNGSIGVQMVGLNGIGSANITTSGWYTFKTTFEKDTSGNVSNTMSVIDSTGHTIGSFTVVSSLPFADLTGTNYGDWTTVWEDGFANDVLGIDNVTVAQLPTSASATINVADAPLTGSSAATAGGTEGAINSSVLSGATFTDANPGNNSGDFTATITWGDSGPTSLGTVSYDSVHGVYTVSGSHTYAEEGSYNISIAVVDDGGQTAAITGTATVADASLTGSSAATAAGTEGQTNSSVLSGATFTDANPGNNSGDFTATITWGDSGPTSLGTVSYDSVHGVYTVSGSHTYAEEGSYNISIAVVDDGGQTAAITGTATVADASLTGSSAATAAGTEGQTNSSVLSGATFTDANPGNNSGDFTATITWGDSGPTSLGTVSYDSVHGVYTVSGSHTYAEEGSYNISIAVVDDGGQTAAITGTATVADASLTGSSAATAAGTEGQTNSSVLSGATFTDANPGNNSGDFTATITWGDSGPTSLGTVSYDSVHGVYTVSGSHTYAEEGSYNISIAVVDDGGQTAAITGTATVADAALTAGALTPPVATEGAAFTNTTVFHFSDGDPAGTASDYSALVTLGDGHALTLTSTASANGQIVAHVGGGFDVQLSYTYLEELTNQTFSVAVTDAGGSMTSASTSTFSVADAALTAGTVTANGGVEGTTATTLSATFSDANHGAPTADFSGTINWGDGVTTPFTSSDVTGSNGSYAVNGLHTYNEFGTYPITVSVNDDGGQTTTISGSTMVADVAPSNVNLVLTTSHINEDGSTSLSGSFTDPGLGDTHTVSINWGDGSPNTNFSLAAGVLSFSGKTHQYLDNPTGQPDGSFTIGVTVTDNDSESGSGSTSVEVDNVAPSAGLTVNTSSPYAEGSPIDLTASASDISPVDQSAGFTYSWVITQKIGNASPTVYASHTTGSGQVNADINFTPDLAGTYVVSLVATDKDGGTSTAATQSFTVVTTPPTVDLSHSATSTNEGSTYTLVVGNVTDPGPNDVVGYFINWGDSSPNTGSPTAGNPQGMNFTHVYEDGPSSPVIEITIIDSEKTSTDVASLNVTVNNVAPTATIQNFFPTITVGASGEVALTNPMDPSPVDTSHGFTYYLDFTDNATDTAGTYVSNGANNSATVPASDLSAPGTYYVGERIEDKDGGFTDYVTSIVVNDTPPIVSLGSAATVGQNQLFTRAGSFSYPGNNGPYTALVDYNFGGVGDTGFTPLTLNGNGFTLSNTYTATGNYTIEVKVTDASNTTGVGTLAVNVTPTNFQVTGFTPTASGFDVTFNRAPNLGVLNLYAGPTNQYGAPDLTLVGQNTGQVEGSFVWDPTTNTGHFIKTGGVLVPDNYMVTLVSGATSFEDTGGALLAGNNGVTPGTNYTTSFSMAAANDTVSIPDFARGPGQAINVPYNTSGGLPITISNGTGVTAVDFNLDYNPSLLNIGNVTAAGDLPAGWTVNFFNNPMTGVLSVSVFGSTGLSSGVQTLVNVTSTVPASATYGASGELKFDQLRINEGNIASTADAAVEKVAFLGNSDGITGIENLNHTQVLLDVYDPQDAFLIDYAVVQHLASNPNAGFDAYPLTDPLIVGDVTQDGTLSGQDASLVAQTALGLSHVLPAIPMGFNPSTSVPPPGTDPVLTIGNDVLGNPGGTVVVPVSIDVGSGLTAGSFTFAFDSSKLTLTGATLGGVDASGFTVGVNGDQVQLFSNGSAVGSGSGTIVNLDFSIASNAAAGVVPVNFNDPTDLNGGTETITGINNGSVNIAFPIVGTTRPFYGGSSFDTGGGNQIASDLNAVATDKTALLPGQTATFTNVTSYVSGVNGLLVDFPNLVAGTVLSTSDFQFDLGSGNTWSPLGAVPTILTGTDPGNGQVMADITWTGSPILNTWVRVTVLADGNDHLAANSVFYYGNLVGATGVSGSASKLTVKGADVTATQANVSPTRVVITNLYDFDRSGKVQGPDVSIVQGAVNPAGLLLFTAAAPPSGPSAGSVVSGTSGSPLKVAIPAAPGSTLLATPTGPGAVSTLATPTSPVIAAPTLAVAAKPVTTMGLAAAITPKPVVLNATATMTSTTLKSPFSAVEIVPSALMI